MALTQLPPTSSGARDLAPPPATRAGRAQRAVAGLLIIGPLVGVALGTVLLWGHAVHLRDVIVAVVLYVVTGHGITVGYHRMFTHRSFRPNRPLKVALAVAGSMAVQGSVISWVAAHRRHHVFSDHAGDPHSPALDEPTLMGQLRGFAHAHMGWFFLSDPTSAERFAPDLVTDHDVAAVSRLFPVFAVATFAIPFGLGWLLSGNLAGALACLVWAGLARVAVLHHVTWSINSVCHMFGKRPFRTNDRSRNVAFLALISMGESWHNLHHAYPSSARHGVQRGELDSSARLIRLFERFGWATKVRWPAPGRLVALAAV